MQGGSNVFLTGMAGTGKSTALLAYIGQAFRSVDVCATTGIAALNLQQQFQERAGAPLPAHTIYRWAGILTGPAAGQDKDAFWGVLNKRPMPQSRLAAFARVRKAEVLVIDEISMMPGRVLDYLDMHCKRLREDPRPFGGIQLIAVGDFCQLPPVARDGRYDWAFACQSWQEARFKSAYLTQIHRQDEPEFVAALNAFRVGQIDKQTANILASRVQMFVDRRVPRLMTHNAQVDKWCTYQLGEVDGEELTYNAECAGNDSEVEYLRKNLVTPSVLTLRVGARVMVTCNLTDAAGDLIAVNGQCGTVAELGADRVAVRIDGGDVVDLSQQTWRYDPHRDDSGTFAQIPLRLAYAMTIHKSQGLTLDRAHIDIRAAREPGQAYVALSRLRSLSGLHLKDWIKGVHVSDAALQFYNSL